MSGKITRTVVYSAAMVICTLLAMTPGLGAGRVDPIGAWSCVLYGPPGLGDERLLLQFDPNGATSIARLDSENTQRWTPISQWENSRGTLEFADTRTGRRFEAELDRDTLGGRWSTAASRGGWWCTPYAGGIEMLPREPEPVESSVMPPLIPTTMGTPFYPRQAIREAKEGRAVVCFEVDSAGLISRPEFLELSDEVFRLSTLGALQRSRYKGWNDPTIVRPACRSFQYFLDSIF